MMKNTFTFEVSFNLNTANDEKLDWRSIQDFRDSLEGFVRSWNGHDGYFYAYGPGHDTDIDPTAIKVKRVKKLAR
jgi:hypothetical protein